MALTVLVVVMACHVACSLRWLVVRRCTPPSGRRLDRTAPTPWGTRAPRGDGRSGWRSPRRCRGHVGTVRTQDHPRFSGPLALRSACGQHRPAAVGGHPRLVLIATRRSEEHTSELQSLMRISYAVFCLKHKN